MTSSLPHRMETGDVTPGLNEVTRARLPATQVDHSAGAEF